MDLEYFYCDHCGCEILEPVTVRYWRTVANGDICECPCCQEDVLINDNWIEE